MQPVLNDHRYPWFNGLALALAVLLCLPPPDVLAASSSKSFFVNRKANHTASQQRAIRELGYRQQMQRERKGEEPRQARPRRQAGPLSLAALSDLSAINIPAEDGQILEVWSPADQPRDASQPTVILLQDLHTQEEAQLAEGRILQHLHKTYNVKLIASEGAEGPFQIEFFKQFPGDDLLRTAVAKTFLAAGEMSGHEYQIITEQLPIDVHGVEDMELHTANTEAYLQVLDAAPTAQATLTWIQEALIAKEPELYSGVLQELMQQGRRFQTGELGMPDYVDWLRRQTQGQGIAFGSLAPNLARLSQIQAREGAVDRQQVEAEFRQLLAALTSKLQTGFSSRLSDELEQLSQQFQRQAVAASYFYPRLLALSKEARMELSQYPQVVAFAEYLELTRTLQSHRIAPELEEVEWVLTARLAGSEEAKQLVKVSRHAKLLRDLFALHLTPDQLAYFREHRDEFTSEMFAEFVEEEHNGVIDATVPLAERFYNLAKQRDHVLIDNTLRLISSQKPKTKNQKPKTKNQKPKTKNLKPYCLLPEAFTRRG